MTLTQLQHDLHALQNPAKAVILARFFKTGKGEYGEGDQFLGITVPQTREVVKRYHTTITLLEIKQLLHDPFHEMRLAALLLLVEKFKKASEVERKQIVDFYLDNAKFVNNWDLVDLSAHYILGAYLLDKPNERAKLDVLAHSLNLWERRIAIVSTFAFIRNRKFEDTFRIAIILIHDKHDLIHKAVGWMLREVGKKNEKALEEFLQKHYTDMPRTMLRCAIERFSEEKRLRYMKG